MSLARDVTTIGSATLGSRLLGFFRDICIAAVLGAGALSDAYFAALQIPNLFRRLLAEGALNSAFVPMWLRTRDADSADAARGFGEQVFGAVLVAMGAIAILCIVFAPAAIDLIAPGFSRDGDRFGYAVAFVRLSAPYIAIAGLVAVAASILNAERRVAAVAVGIVVFNCVLVGAVLIVLGLGNGASERSGAILAVSVTLAGLAQLAVVGAALWRLPTRPRRLTVRLSADVRRFFARAIPGAVASGVPQLTLIAGAMVASSSPAAVSWLYYANRLYELPLGIVSVAIASVLAPHIAASVRAAGRADVVRSQSRAFDVALGLALPASVGLALLSQPIAAVLFERGAFGPNDTLAVAAALTAISAGLPGHALEKVLGAVSFAHEDTHTPMFAGLAGLAAAAIAAVALFPAYAQVGVAAAIAIAGWVGTFLLSFILLRRGWLVMDRPAVIRLAAIVVATALMAAAIVVVQTLLGTASDAGTSTMRRIGTLAVTVVAGLAVYLIALRMLGIARIRDIIGTRTRP